MATAIARDSFFGPNRRLVRKGEKIDMSDPIVKGRESLFILPDDDSPTEAATAAPGEKRSTARSTKS